MKKETELQDKWHRLGWEDCENKVKSNIGLLRQLINEKPDGMLLTNKQIEDIIFNIK